MLGPEPLLISRKEVDALYEIFEAIIKALKELKVDYIVTGGSLLGAVRQHSILFCDDDIDIAIIDRGDGAYDRVSKNLARLLGDEFTYNIRPWEGADKIRLKRMTTVFVDLFTLRRFENIRDLEILLETKKNGQPQPKEYVEGIVNTITNAAKSQGEHAPLSPFWHFNTRKAVELWPKEVYRENELFPLNCNYKFGPLAGITGPRMPVTLLKRAFGTCCFEVYYESVSHKIPNKVTPISKGENEGEMQLKPLVKGGGVWESSEETKLQDIHYVPMQPIARKKRRETMHNREQLFAYLETQTKLEYSWQHESTPEKNINEQCETRPRQTVYMDGVFDLFHIGHLRAIQKCAKLGDRVIIGVVGDIDGESYKRRPIIPEDQRVALVAAVKEVDKVICPCPFIVTLDFMKEHEIDLVVHGFANDEDANKQTEFFKAPLSAGKFQRIPYCTETSTTEIITRIKNLDTKGKSNGSDEQQTSKSAKPQWFGATLAECTGHAADIPYDPFPLKLRIAIEPHIQKANKNRDDRINILRTSTGFDKFDDVLKKFTASELSKEGQFSFDTAKYSLRESFLTAARLPLETDLSKLHTISATSKKELFDNVKGNSKSFQTDYVEFVLQVCAPRFAKMFDDTCDEIYFQAFPCIRVIQPKEFSIGPHADIAYGHHPCSVNFYVPLTWIGGASALYLESVPGREDWHPITGEYGEIVKHFSGAMCMHWTTDNETHLTRVSLDFRLIAGSLFHEVNCTDSQFFEKPGYFGLCKRKDDGQWYQEGDLLDPDARVGYPWAMRKSKAKKKMIHT
eukprot:m.344866 g.344866  ORF g.344866 m.344866 type:complete len:796 (-) comp25346_c0_seq1:16-2403(-)